MVARTLADYLASHASIGTPQGAVAATVAALAEAAIRLSDTIAVGVLGGRFGAAAGAKNADGDAQKGLDIVADEIFLDAASRAPVALYVSEEQEHPVQLKADAPVALAIDPLDGSSGIEVNVSIGTIFSLLPVIEGDLLASVLQPGRKQLGAGFFVYGPQLALVLSLGAGTQIFVYSPRLEAFIEAYAELAIPHKTSEYAINASNWRHWEDPVRHYIEDCLKGSEGPQGRDFNMRWIASLVADTYRILIRGGVFLYPADNRKGYSRGRLRLVYEANPIALLVEQAGGTASNCREPILDVVPRAIHERTPLVFGSKTEVQQVLHYHDPEAAGLSSPLFGHRSLFRN
jgi:fructose-1,6-bisphosphatase I